MWSPHRIAGVVIVVIWLSAMGLLVARETTSPAAQAPRHVLTGPVETWMKVLLPGGKQAGYLKFLQLPEARHEVPGQTLSVQSRAVLNLLGQPSELFVQGEAWRALDLSRSEFEFRMRASEHVFSAAGTLHEGLLKAELRTGGETIPVTLPIGDDFDLSVAGMGGVPDVSALEPGESVVIPTFDPMSLAMGKSTLTVERRETITLMGEDIPATVVTIGNNGMTNTAWLGPEGDTLRIETSFGFTLERTSQYEALEDEELADTTDLLRIASIRPTGEAPFRGASRMAFRISGLEAGTTPEQDSSQRLDGDGVWHVAPVGPGGGDEHPLADGKRWLMSSAFIQADHPRIGEKAREIVGETTDPQEQAIRLYNWVYEEVAKVPVVSLPSALEVLDTMEGDCNEHTILYTALARSIGLPTEIAIGVVWSKEFNAFYYHAWPEVYVGRWVWMDPTLGQEVADATHIKLLTGGLDQWIRLAPYLTRLQIEVLEIE